MMENSSLKRRLLSPALPLFWRLFISLLLLLLITSAISITMERWINAKTLESRMTQHVDHLLSIRQTIINHLSTGDYKRVQTIYRQERGLRDQIFIVDEQGMPLFSITRPMIAGPFRNQKPINDRTLANIPTIDDVKASIDDSPNLQDISISIPNGQTFIIQTHPRLPIQDLINLRKTYLPLRLGIILLFSLLACYWFSRGLSVRISWLQQVVHRLGDGEYEAGESLSQLGDDELGELGNDIAQLAKKLSESELSRKQMLSDISHELRSPLARLEVASELTRDYAPDAQHYLDRIQREIARMNALIAQIIHIQSLQMQRYTTSLENNESVNIPVMLDEIGRDVRFEFQRKQIAWQCVCSDEPSTFEVMGNREQIHSALENVVRNAFIHSKAHSNVEVTITSSKLASAKSALKISIADHGPGIDEADLERIFYPFVRLDASRHKRQEPSHEPSHNPVTPAIDNNDSSDPLKKDGGSGLGLAIAQAIINAHKGHITARNRDDGYKGLIIDIILPTSN